MIPSLTGSLTGTKLGSLHGDVGQDGLFILWLNVWIDVPPPKWHKAYNVSLFGGVSQYDLFIFIVKCNNGGVLPQPNWYQLSVL